MWIEELDNGKYKYNERYKNPLTERYNYVSVTLNSKSNQAKKQAQSILNDKIEKKTIKVIESDMTFEQVYDEWIVIYKNKVKQSTYFSALSAYRIVSQWFDKKALVRNVKASFIQNLLDDFYYKQDHSHSYTDLLRTFLSNVFEHAKRIGAVDANIMRDVKLKNDKLKDKNENLSDKFLEQDEIYLVLDEMKKWPKVPRKYRFAEGLELMSLTGMRYGEMAALKNDDVDGNLLRIDETLFYNYKVKKGEETNSPKNNSSNRTIALSNRSIEILDKWKKENEYNRKLNTNYDPSGYLFCETDGTFIGVHPINRLLGNIRKKLSNEGKLDKYITTHTFRHSHISMLAELGIPLKAIMDRVGHTNPNTTLKIYTHVTKKMELDLINKLNEKEKRN
ncbi:MAG TPA: site-specific integrase [Candidatus Enterococcus avicola]|uniref:Site-specific integrase n=1 Tax=Candidatus Enterococcus avicola TaxID=2838561 RepID=A0A9D2F764_9ENTE|nr:site-specific integrase [Candidatus Enterococcus avicola]